MLEVEIAQGTGRGGVVAGERILAGDIPAESVPAGNLGNILTERPGRCRRTGARVGPQPGDERGQSGTRTRTIAWDEPLDVDPRRPEARALRERWISQRPPQAGGRVMRADEHRTSAGDALARRVEKTLGMRLDGVLERAAMHLDGVRNLAAQRPGKNGGAHHQMIGQGDVGARTDDDLAHRGDVRIDVVRDLGIGALGERARLHPLVAIGNVHGQQRPDVWAVDGATHTLVRPAPRQRTHAQDSLVPVARSVNERLTLGMAILAEQMHLVSKLDQRRCQPRVVYVRTGPLEQVAVKDQDAHRVSLSRPRPPAPVKSSI